MEDEPSDDELRKIIHLCVKKTIGNQSIENLYFNIRDDNNNNNNNGNNNNDGGGNPSSWKNLNNNNGFDNEDNDRIKNREHLQIRPNYHKTFKKNNIQKYFANNYDQYNNNNNNNNNNRQRQQYYQQQQLQQVQQQQQQHQLSYNDDNNNNYYHQRYDSGIPLNYNVDGGFNGGGSGGDGNNGNYPAQYDMNTNNKKNNNNNNNMNRDYGSNAYSIYGNNNGQNEQNDFKNNNNNNNWSYHHNNTDSRLNTKQDKQRQHDGACIVHCFFGELNMLNNDDYPDKRKVIQTLLKDVQNNDLREFYTESVKECFHLIEIEKQHKDKCEFSKTLINCMTDYAKANCEDWDESATIL